MKRHLLTLICFALILLSGVFTVAAQNVTGTITGLVQDQTGALVPGVTVRATNTATNETKTVRSDNAGRYSVPALPIGVYRLTAEADGFKQYQASNITLQVNETPRVDITLEIGDIAESVEVEASVVNVDTESATLKTVVDRRRVEDLPLNGRDALQLTRLVAGVQLYEGAGVTSGATYPGVVPISVNGSRGNAVNYMVDGANSNDHYNNAPSAMPNPDALAEFSVQTNNFSAEFGRNLGGVVNVVTKSGTNELHGSVYEYLRHHELNAGNFFAPEDPEDPTKKLDDGLKRSQFGATVGGPVLIPKLYDGRDKTFFFFSYEGTRVRRRPTTDFAESYTAAEKSGDFSALLPDTVLRNPFTGGVYPNNQIPASDFSAVSKYLAENIMPTGDSDHRVLVTEVESFNDDEFLIKGDHLITASNKVTGRYSFSKAEEPGMLDPNNYLARVTASYWRNHALALTDTHIFGPTLLNSVTFGYNRTIAGDAPIQPEKDLGDLGVNIPQDTDKQIYVKVYGPMETYNTGETESELREEYQITDILRWSLGRHQLSIGGEYGYGIGDNTGNFRSNGRFYFRHDAGFTGYAPADFLIGKFESFTQSLGSFKETRFQRASLFLQDSVQVTRRFNLDVGLRWEPFFPFTDKMDRVAGWAPGQQSSRYINAPPGILYAGDPGVPSGIYDTVWKNFAPRIGIAYDLTGDGKTSLRAGYGIFYDQPNTITTNSASQQAPYGTTVDVFGTSVNSFEDPYAGYPGGSPFTVVGNSAFGTDALAPPADVAFPTAPSVFLYDFNFRNPYSQAWNFTLEREVIPSWVARATYAGSKGTRLASGRDVNAPLPDASASTSTTNARRPFYPSFGRMVLIEGVGNSIYNSLQLSMEKRFSQGFSVLANYTWSKTIDNNLGSANKATGTSVTNPLDQSFDRGLADFDKAHVFNFSGLWDLPVRFDNRVANTILGGWSLSSIVSLQSGFPFTVFSNEDNARTGQEGQRGNLVGNPDFPDGRSTGEKINEWLRADAFVPNALGTYGTLGRNSFRGPGRANVDFGLRKQFPIMERLMTEFRFEAFNAFNTPNFENPEDRMDKSDFMRITDAYDPRILQFALRVTW